MMINREEAASIRLHYRKARAMRNLKLALYHVDEMLREVRVLAATRTPSPLWTSGPAGQTSVQTLPGTIHPCDGEFHDWDPEDSIKEKTTRG